MVRSQHSGALSAPVEFETLIPRYALFSDHLAGRRILDLGAKRGSVRDWLLHAGADSVAQWDLTGSLPPSPDAFEDPFDVLLVEDFARLEAARPGWLRALHSQLGTSGFGVIGLAMRPGWTRLSSSAASDDERGPPDDLTRALREALPEARMFAQAPFAGVVVEAMEMERGGADLRMDATRPTALGARSSHFAVFGAVPELPHRRLVGLSFGDVEAAVRDAHGAVRDALAEAEDSRARIAAALGRQSEVLGEVRARLPRLRAALVRRSQRRRNAPSYHPGDGGPRSGGADGADAVTSLRAALADKEAVIDDLRGRLVAARRAQGAAPVVAEASDGRIRAELAHWRHRSETLAEASTQQDAALRGALRAKAEAETERDQARQAMQAERAAAQRAIEAAEAREQAEHEENRRLRETMAALDRARRAEAMRAHQQAMAQHQVYREGRAEQVREALKQRLEAARADAEARARRAEEEQRRLSWITAEVAAERDQLERRWHAARRSANALGDEVSALKQACHELQRERTELATSAAADAEARTVAEAAVRRLVAARARAEAQAVSALQGMAELRGANERLRAEKAALSAELSGAVAAAPSSPGGEHHAAWLREARLARAALARAEREIGALHRALRCVKSERAALTRELELVRSQRSREIAQ